MTIKVTKDGVSTNIVADMAFAKEVYPTSDGYTHELVVPESTGDGSEAARYWRNE